MFDILQREIATSVSICVILLLTLSANGIQFIEQKTGFNTKLNLFEMEATNGTSRLACGVLCEEKLQGTSRSKYNAVLSFSVCTINSYNTENFKFVKHITGCLSFLYEELSKQCRIFSVYMTDDCSESIGRYYRMSDAEEYEVVFEDNTCGSDELSRHQGVNVALNKSVTLSSIYETGVGSLMTNGSRGNIYPCACTNTELYPWAIVDLGQVYTISSMYIVNRIDCCSWRLHDLVIQVGNSLSNLTTVFTHTEAIEADCNIMFNSKHQGRFVKLYIDDTEILTVCELEVYSCG